MHKMLKSLRLGWNLSKILSALIWQAAAWRSSYFCIIRIYRPYIVLQNNILLDDNKEADYYL